MISLQTINESYSSVFGMMIKVLRTSQKLTLRGLAKKASLSHTFLNKLEHGEVNITKETYDKLTNALAFNINFDEKLNQAFFNLSHTLQDARYFGTLDEMVYLMDELESHEYYYLNSFLMIEYMAFYASIYYLPKYKKVDKAKAYIDLISTIEDMLTNNLLEYYTVAKSAYNFHFEMYDESLKYAINLIETYPMSRFIGIYYYFTGRVYSELYQMTQSNDYFHRAIRIFEQQNNLRRVMYTKLYIEINNIKMYRYTKAEKTFNQIIQYAKKESLSQLLVLAKLNRMIYYVLSEQYHEAILASKDFPLYTNQYYFYLAFAYLKINDFEQLKKAIFEGRNTPHKVHEVHAINDKGFDFLEALITKKHPELEKRLSAFFEATLDANAYVKSQIAYDYYINYLVENRQYKKAYDVTQTMIDVTKKVMQ
ncbi:MAG: helix-turn-helix domain-containing protein [Candidatus Izemoplasmataceae bacterium]